MTLNGVNTVVVGMASSGVAAATFLVQQGAKVTISEQKTAEELGELPLKLASLGIILETGGHKTETFRSADLIVLSPGVNPSITPLNAAKKRGIPIVSEIELASWFINRPLIAITGTNGKSTTTALIGHLLSSSGKTVFVGGNIGTPLTEYLLDQKATEYIVAEISSYQLETTVTFRPWIAILLNIGEDHLDRHPTTACYAAVKGRIFHNQGEGDWAIVNAEDPNIAPLFPQIKSQVVTFGTRGGRDNHVWLENPDKLSYECAGKRGNIPLNGVKLKGMHNRQNIMAAVGAAVICDLNCAMIEEALSTFTGLEHRLELVGKWKGVEVYNDSKATNVASAITALQSLKGPLLLIAGGRDKGGDYTPMRDLIREKVKTLILLGEARERMREAFQDLVPIELVQGMEEGVRLAWELAQEGDTILLSPACSSFDMFKDYQERGRVFKEIVRRVVAGE